MPPYLLDPATDAARAFFQDNGQDQRDLQRLRRLISTGRKNLVIVHVDLSEDTITEEKKADPAPDPQSFITYNTHLRTQ